ncbi:MAG TPA: hypothetical protein VE263_17790 [Candidatus Angelobacter sp.]|nr:hypothetical protein [Candidatus Angelobacter sp.]
MASRTTNGAGFAIAGDSKDPAIAYYKGGMFCQSAHFNRAGAAVRKRTGSAPA